MEKEEKRKGLNKETNGISHKNLTTIFIAILVVVVVVLLMMVMLLWFILRLLLLGFRCFGSRTIISFISLLGCWVFGWKLKKVFKIGINWYKFVKKEYLPSAGVTFTMGAGWKMWWKSCGEPKIGNICHISLFL